MSHIKDHSRKYQIIEKAKKVYECPNLDKILPPNIDAIEDKMTEEEFNKFVTKKFNEFFSKYIDSSSKELFICLPIEFFTTENIDRVRRYANIALFIKEETADMKYQKDYYENLHNRLLEMLKKKNQELISKNNHEKTF